MHRKQATGGEEGDHGQDGYTCSGRAGKQNGGFRDIGLTIVARIDARLASRSEAPVEYLNRRSPPGELDGLMQRVVQR